MTDRLYYGDSFLKNFPARVTDVRLHSRAAGQSTWQIALDRSVFYPTSGGQPHDVGVLTATSRGGAVLAVEVDSVDEDEQGEVWHTTSKPLLAGTEVSGAIDWPRRLDHMQQHSGQHLLSAVFASEIDVPTVSFHLGETASTIDLATESIASHSLERLERIANELIAEDRAISVRNVSRAEAEAMLTEGKLRKLPPRAGDLRLIEIEDFDLNACGGTHLRSTGQIGGLHLRGHERVKQGMRVEFVCGLRAAASARADYLTLGGAAAILSARRGDLPDAVGRLVAETKNAQKERQKLSHELAQYHAARLAVEEQIEHGLREVRRIFCDRDADYIKLLASQLVASVPQTVAVLVSTEQDPAAVVFARSSDLGFNCGKLLKELLAKLGLRGGGSADLAQGKVPSSQAAALAIDLCAAARHEL